MAADELLLLNLFDSNWFGQAKIVPTITQTPSDQLEYVDDHDDLVSFSPPTVHINVRSLSDHHLMVDTKSSFFSSSDSLSPSSVLAAPKLQTIFSGKEMKEEEKEEGNKEEAVTKSEELEEEVLPVKKEKKKVNESRLTRRRTRSKQLGETTRRKSLSDLEFEELKGFLDLGFVFTEEECKDSKLVSMIPGLQRFCKKCGTTDRSEEKDDVLHQEDDRIQSKIERRSEGISRPYLSEAWDVLDSEYQNRKRDENMMNWKIPTLVTDVDMKDQLRFWAHTVASTVR
ncbi:hypothetical protein TIFTF001_036312 [Ficus carica]|uniref:Uncharacterized protein n=1 Tax=Ficus carica TaxID=3494 RepID=A0AA88E410_FICCA|nr:hypothetical protein TIFTF001_036298 [Ficus carica]GMN67252.1 hypothetical protein TIFTF001_036312 [Ficus carica]